MPRLIDEPAAEAPNRSKIGAVFFAGLASWIFAYALTLTNYPPTQQAGRLTSTHVAAVFGLACSIAALAAYLRSFSPSALKTTIAAVMSVAIGWLVLYSFRIQSGFAYAWTQERRFWQQVIQRCPDITPNTRIFLIGNEPKQNEFILSNSWADPLVLEDAFPGDKRPIFFYYTEMGGLADIRFENGQVTWKPHFWGDEHETLDLNNVIILQDDGNDLTRIDEFKMREVPFPLQTKKLLEPQPHPDPTPLTDFGRFLLRP